MQKGQQQQQQHEYTMGWSLFLVGTTHTSLSDAREPDSAPTARTCTMNAVSHASVDNIRLIAS